MVWGRRAGARVGCGLWYDGVTVGVAVFWAIKTFPLWIYSSVSERH